MLWAKRLVAPVLFVAMSCVAMGQSSSPVQSPRQAVIEIISGGVDGLKKHQTVEVQQQTNSGTTTTTTATDTNPMPGPLGILETLKSDGVEIQTFPAGPVLMTLDNSKLHKKLEVHVESEEIRGSSAQMDLSFVSFDNGKEQSLPMEFRMVLGLKLQENVWRLNTITGTVKLPVGDPRFYDNNFWSSPQSTEDQDGIDATGSIAGSLLGVSPNTQGKTQKQKIPVVRALRLIGLAESIYQQKHPQAGYTCKLKDLINVGKGFGIGDTDENYTFIDSDLASGQYNGYHFALIGCQGTPVTAFRVIAEPLSGGGRAYCSDASRTVRASDDGRGATCVIAGKPTMN